jgi:predicted HicB family RNase H-like nuclease
MATAKTLMTKKKTYGTTRSGVPITDELIEKLSAQAERGFDVEEILRRRKGRPPMGSGPAKVESVRLDPELREALVRRAASDEEATSTVIRKALRQYLRA